MELRQRPELRQKVTLSPQVFQGLNILAMPIAELQQLIEVEILENPVLEVEEPESEPQESEVDEQSADTEDRSWDDWLEMYDDLDRLEVSVPRDPDAEKASTEEYVGGVQSLGEYLNDQLAMLDLSEKEDAAARAVIGSLDNDGYFTGSLDEVARIVGVDLKTAERGLAAVQQLDPIGVAARDLSEALRLQLEFLQVDEPLLLRIIDEHLSDVASSHFRRIARALRVSEDEVRRLVDILKMLNPRPAGAYSSGPAPGYLVPDVVVRRFDDEWLILPNGDALPPIRISSRYRDLLRKGSSADDVTRRYLKEKIRSAESFIHNVDRRKNTVTRITEIILESQRDFFEDGHGPLRPMRLEDVAVELGVHLSTVSRGVTGKYMATPYGLFELKHFFSGGYRTSSGMDVASTSIKQRLRELVGAEEPAHPYSDQKLAEMLSDEGVTVARRTVAKYREELGIDPSWVRRRR